MDSVMEKMELGNSEALRNLNEVLVELYIELGWIEEMEPPLKGYRITKRGRLGLRKLGMDARGKSFGTKE